MSAADDETAPAPAPAAPTLRAGDVVGRYRIEARAGGGGMGVVYRAVDTTLGRTVALKFLAPQLAGTGDGRARLLREARAASALDHPHIGVVYEVGEHAGGAFIAMAFYDGETLKQRIARGPVPVDEAERLTRQLASALHAAHAAGIAHRDVKPANVLIARDGSARLVDFGLAKLLDEATAEALTASGAIIGTLLYMAPEQLRGDGADARADLWALGAVAHEMLTGRPPFARVDRAATITAILNDDPPPLGDTVPARLQELVYCLLDKDRDKRVASASEVLSVLDRTAPAPRRRRARRRWLLPAALALVVATAAGAAAWRFWPTDGRRARDEYVRGTREFDLGHYDVALAHFENAYRLMGDASLLFNVAQMYRLGGRPHEAATLYRRYLEAWPDAPNRGAVEEKISRLDAPPLAEEPHPATAKP